MNKGPGVKLFHCSCPSNRRILIWVLTFICSIQWYWLESEGTLCLLYLASMLRSKVKKLKGRKGMICLDLSFILFQVTPDLHSSGNSPNSSISISPSGTSSEGTHSPQSSHNQGESRRSLDSTRRNQLKFQHSVLSSADMTTNIKSAAKRLERDEWVLYLITLNNWW